jgi:DNA-binding response OmpR family regulator
LAWTLLMVGCPTELEQQLRSLISSNLMHLTVIEQSGKRAFDRDAEKADLIVLHEAGAQQGLPLACRHICSITDVPIITIAEEYNDDTMSETFEAGGNDYIPAACSPRELLARIRAQLRRAHEYTDKSSVDRRLELRQLTVDVARHEVTVRGSLVNLTPKEFELLTALGSHCDKAVSREQLLKEIWGFNEHGNTRTLDVHIGRLRQKIEKDPAEPTIIVTVPGYGYKLKG